MLRLLRICLLFVFLLWNAAVAVGLGYTLFVLLKPRPETAQANRDDEKPGDALPAVEPKKPPRRDVEPANPKPFLEQWTDDLKNPAAAERAQAVKQLARMGEALLADRPKPKPRLLLPKRPEAKPEAKEEPKEEPKEETKPEPKPETKEEPKPETKEEPKSEPVQEAEEFGFLPMVQKESKDPSLPGTWHILDRSKPVRKLVDRKSLIPTGPKTLAMFEYSGEFVLKKSQKTFFMLLNLPADVGDEQAFLGCMLSMKADKEEIKFEAPQFVQGRGNRFAEVVVKDCPADTPVTVSMKYIVLVPPSLSALEKAKITEQVRQRQAKSGYRPAAPGFPEPEFEEGGPQFLNLPDDGHCYRTIHSILKTTEKIIAYDLEGKLKRTSDPDVAKRNQKGKCVERCRVAEKSLCGITRTIFVGVNLEPAVGENLAGANGDYPGQLHAILLIEDPQSGRYFVGDVQEDPFMGPLTGGLLVFGNRYCRGIPEPNGAKWYDDQPMVALNMPLGIADQDAVDYSKLKSPKIIRSSQCGKEAAKYRAWLKNLPDDFKDLEKRLNVDTTKASGRK